MNTGSNQWEKSSSRKVGDLKIRKISLRALTREYREELASRVLLVPDSCMDEVIRLRLLLISLIKSNVPKTLNTTLF